MTNGDVVAVTQKINRTTAKTTKLKAAKCQYSGSDVPGKVKRYALQQPNLSLEYRFAAKCISTR